MVTRLSEWMKPKGCAERKTTTFVPVLAERPANSADDQTLAARIARLEAVFGGSVSGDGALEARVRRLEEGLQSLERTMQARMEQLVASGVRETFLQTRRRAGAIEIARRQVTNPPSKAVKEAAAFLRSLSEEDRCEYMFSLCEELKLAARWRYDSDVDGDELGDDLTVSLFSLDSSPKTAKRVMQSSAGGTQFLNVFLDDKDFGELIARGGFGDLYNFFSAARSRQTA